MMMFDFLIEAETKEYQERLEGYRWGEALVRELGLEDLVPLTTRLGVYRPTRYVGKVGHPDWSVSEYKAASCVEVSLYLRWEDREEARGVVFESGIDMDKHYYISQGDHRHPDYLVEAWKWQRGKGYFTDRVEIEFYRPVEEGETLGKEDEDGGCVVRRMDRVNSYTELVIACEKGERERE